MELGRPIAVGNTADIYFHDGRIIKLFHDGLPDTEAAYEAAKQQVAHSCGLPVPQIFAVCRVNGKQAIVMEYIEGTTLGDLIQRDTAHADTYLSLCVDLQMEIHAKSAVGLESMGDRLAWQLERATALDDTCRATLLKKLVALPAGNKLCHGDYHAFNLIQSENNTVIIDWVDASSGNPCADVCRSYLLYANFSADLANCYLHLYCEKSGLSPGDIFAWAPMVAGARLSENISLEETERLLKIIRQYL